MSHHIEEGERVIKNHWGISIVCTKNMALSFSTFWLLLAKTQLNSYTW